jgi:hypothetical protein
MTMILLKSVKLLIKIAFSVLAVTVFTATSASSQTTGPLPSADDVVSRMVRSDIERRSELTGYTALRRYAVVSKDRQAEMVVRLDCSPEGTKQFTIISEEGSSAIRKHVFYKMLREESEMSRRETRDSSRITPANYKFYLVGRQNLDIGPAYVLTIFPKTEKEHLIQGTIWVSAQDYSIVRIEGQPARNPSFWVHNVHFVHTYQRVGQFWFASSTHSTSEVRIFGPSDLTIENSDYKLNPPRKLTQEESVASLVR